MSVRVALIRRTHASAKPNPAENPAWFHAENDIAVLLAEVTRLEQQASAWEGIACKRTADLAKADAEIARLNELNLELSRANAEECSRLQSKATGFSEVLCELFAADDAYGCGFYSDARWIGAYKRLRAMSDGSPPAEPEAPDCPTCAGFLCDGEVLHESKCPSIRGEPNGL